MRHHGLFYWFYRAFFVTLYLILTGLLIITPSDVIYQVRHNNNAINQVRYYVVIAGVYGLTIFLAICIYANRFFTNRSALKDIPKTYIPIGKGEVSTRTRAMIDAGLRRSVAIAWDSRPRAAKQLTTIVNEPNTKDDFVRIPDVDPEPLEKGKKKEHSFLHPHHSHTEKDDHAVLIPPYEPVWGEISHNGWSSPTSPDLPNLQYTTVILELPHLIEARAVSMAPPNPKSTANLPMPDLRAIDLLQRPAAMGLRDYIGHLTHLGVFTTTTTDFLDAYEYARFAPQPLTEPEFRNLMTLFADVLRSVQSLNPTLAGLDPDHLDSDIDDDASTTSTQRSGSIASVHTPISRSGSEGTIRTAFSRRVGTDSLLAKNSEFSTAPATPRNRKRKKSQTRPSVARPASVNSSAQSRRPYNGSSGYSSESLRSTSQESVIRLSTTNDSGHLPYTLTIPLTR